MSVLFSGVLRSADPPSKECYRPCIWSRNWKSDQGPTNGCKAIIIIQFNSIQFFIYLPAGRWPVTESSWNITNNNTNWRSLIRWSPEHWVSHCYAIECDRNFYCSLFCVFMTCVSQCLNNIRYVVNCVKKIVRMLFLIRERRLRSGGIAPFIPRLSSWDGQFRSLTTLPRGKEPPVRIVQEDSWIP
jgi:hypothetical protein